MIQIKKTFGDVDYFVVPLDALDAHELLVTQLIKIASPIFAAFAGADSQANVMALAPKVGEALGQLSRAEVDQLTTKLLASVTAQGVFDGKQAERVDLNAKAKINRVFAGNLKGLYQVLGAVLEVNYRGFFEGLGLVEATAAAKP